MYTTRMENIHSKVDPLFIERWSPRSFKKIPISQEDRETIFDAARLAPSAYNEQPWRVFATETDKDFDIFLSLLAEPNQAWAKNASILGFLITKNHFSHNEKPNSTALFDTGSMWMSLTFQARKLGFFTHGMAGIKHDEIYEHFNIPKDTYTVVAGFAIGVIDSPDKLPEKYQAMEAPSPRLPLSEVYFPGGTQLL